MLTITIPEHPDREYYDETKQEFIYKPGLPHKQTLQLEHSLISLSKWEQIWHIPFLKTSEEGKLTTEQTVSYIKCMTINSNVDPNAYEFIDNKMVIEVNKYITNPMTATVIYDYSKREGNKETITNELIYYWMLTAGIPFECEKWHLNRLITLIRICSIKNGKDQNKMSNEEILRRNAALNAKRRAEMKSKG